MSEVTVYGKDRFVNEFNEQWVAWLEQSSDEPQDFDAEFTSGTLAFFKGSDYHIYAVWVTGESNTDISIYRFSTRENKWIAARDSLRSEALGALMISKSIHSDEPMS